MRPAEKIESNCLSTDPSCFCPVRILSCSAVADRLDDCHVPASMSILVDESGASTDKPFSPSNLDTVCGKLGIIYLSFIFENEESQ